MAEKTSHTQHAERKPRIADIVIYRHDVSGVLDHPAIVTRVIDAETVNLHVMFDGGGGTMWYARARHDGSDAPKNGTWRWW